MKSRLPFLSLLPLVALSFALAGCCSCPRAGSKLPCDGSVPVTAAAAAVKGESAPAVEGAPDGWIAEPGVTVTSQPGDDAWAAYSAAGYRTIVNFRTVAEGADRERELVVANGMQYFNVPVTGSEIAWGDADALAKILANDANRKVLLHCSSGNRAGGAWALYRHWRLGLSPEAAIAEGRRVAPLKPAMVERLQVLLGLREPPCSKKKKEQDMARGVQTAGDSKTEDRSTAR